MYWIVIVPAAAFDYSKAACASLTGPREGCPPIPVVRGPPADGGILSPVNLSDPVYVGDYNTSVPGSVPPGAVPVGVADLFGSAEFAWLKHDLRTGSAARKQELASYHAEIAQGDKVRLADFKKGGLSLDQAGL